MKDAFEKASMLAKGKDMMWTQFWGMNQRFFKNMCIASKVSHAVQMAEKAVKDGKCVVICLQSTGEKHTNEAMAENGDLNEFLSVSK